MEKLRDLTEPQELVERVKELECLFRIAQIFSTRQASLRSMLEDVADAIPAACRIPERTCTRISLESLQVASANFSASASFITGTIVAEDREIGSIDLGFLQKTEDEDRSPFLESERSLLAAICSFVGSKIVQTQMELDLRRTKRALEAQKRLLEQKNIALREILEQVEIEKREIKNQVAANLEHLVMPILGKIRDPNMSDTLLRRYLDIVEQNLKDLASTYTKKIISDTIRLSPREIEIALMIRDGLSSKEIGEQLTISELTVVRHRHNIRRKLGIAAEKINLNTFLKQM